MKNRLVSKYQIKTKEGERMFFVPNRVQRDFSHKRTGRDYILKARQMGVTTCEQLLGLEQAMMFRDISVATIADKRERLGKIFQISKFAWDNLDEEIKELYDIQYDNVRELNFGSRGSKLYVSLDLRGSTVHRLHLSELNFFDDIDKSFASSLEAVPSGGSIMIESTANGLNRGYEIWQEAKRGENGFTPHFYNWTWDSSYREVVPESNTWRDDYKALAKKYNLIEDIQGKLQVDDEQFYWYYLKARILKERVKAEYPCVDTEAFLSQSDSVFSLYNVAQLKPANEIRKYKGWSIYHEPIKGIDYIIGMDTSEGLEGDYSSGEIYGVIDGKLINVASFRDRSIRPDKFGSLSIELGRLYNNALIIPERNSSGLSAVLSIYSQGYKNLFYSKSLESKEGGDMDYGFRTTAINRDMLIDDFISGFEEGEIVVNSPYVIGEMKTFVRKPNGKREHEQGYHDDSLFASFLAVQGRKYLDQIKKDRHEVYKLEPSHIRIGKLGKVRNACIGIHYLPSGIVYQVFGIQDGCVVGVQEGQVQGDIQEVLQGAVGGLKEQGVEVGVCSINPEGSRLTGLLRGLGLRVRIISSPIERGVSRIQGLLEGGKLEISAIQEGLIEEMESYIFKASSIKQGEAKLLAGFRNVEAMRISIMGIWGIAGKLLKNSLQSGQE